MIELSRAETGSIAEQIGKLEDLLTRKTQSDIAEFHHQLCKNIERALAPKFWAAFHLISSGGSRFRAENLIYWLILQGRENYEKIIADPSLLGDFDVRAPLPPTSFNNVALRAYERANGQPLKARPLNVAAMIIAMTQDGRMGTMAEAMKKAAELFPDLHAKFWDAENGQLLQTLSAHKAPVQAVAFARSGPFAATVSNGR